MPTKAREAFLTAALFFVLLVIAAYAVVAQPLVLPDAFRAPVIDPSRLKQHVMKLSQEFYPRSYDRPQKLREAATYIHDELLSAGAKVSEQLVTVDDGKFKNLIAHFGPSEGKVLVIGAHYDTHGDPALGERFPGGYGPESHTPGADDNASGVAGLLELARLLSKYPPKRPVELVAYALEEPPYFRTENMGSVWHARALKANNRPIELMISLEMIGFFSDETGSQHYPVPGMGMLYPNKGNFIGIVGRVNEWKEVRLLKAAMSGASPLPVYSINAVPLVLGIDFSDHQSYWNEGFPALMVTDTAFFRNAEYHQAGDTFEKLDYGRMANVIQGIFAFTQRHGAN